ncbi:hypothetical protein [Paenibacillus naphthalenovorans]|uniref:hypothetical protein n=1 Tax=Paenibacillus naphthalenovorans TaxID=162209 RepID=UPI0010F71862|nr:hypothetical protein [Paenibacillus naphthalenovorans]
MAKFWLMPVQWDGSYAVLGEERLLLEPEQARIRFVEALRPVHPRLLLSFKAELLLADEALEACGTDALPFDLLIWDKDNRSVLQPVNRRDRSRNRGKIILCPIVPKRISIV